MSLINKEPFITPEMISKWNSGGNPFENAQLIYTHEFSNPNPSSTWAEDSLTSQQLSDLYGSKFVFIEVIEKRSSTLQVLSLSSTLNIGNFKDNYVVSTTSPDYIQIGGLGDWLIQLTAKSNALNVQLKFGYDASTCPSAIVNIYRLA